MTAPTFGVEPRIINQANGEFASVNAFTALELNKSTLK
jgi:hypothetical protein